METNQEQNSRTTEKPQKQSGNSSGKKRKNRRRSKKNHSSSSSAAAARAENHQPEQAAAEHVDEHDSKEAVDKKTNEKPQDQAKTNGDLSADENQKPASEQKASEQKDSEKKDAETKREEEKEEKKPKEDAQPVSAEKVDSATKQENASKNTAKEEKKETPQTAAEKSHSSDRKTDSPSQAAKAEKELKQETTRQEDIRAKESADEQKVEEPSAKTKRKKKKKRRKRHGITFYVVIFTFLVVIGSAAAMASLFMSSNNAFFANIPEVELPVFTKMRLDEVLENPEYANFRFKIEEIYSNEVAAGIIADQSPKPPKSVKENATITLKVSKGPESITVPSVVGWNRDTAREKFKDLGLSVLIQSESNENVAPNKVIKTDPEAGAVVQAGDVITMYVSRTVNESTMVTIPNCIGSSQQTAKNILSNMGLVGIVKLKDSSEPAGTVISQSPAAGSRSGSNATVELYVSNGKGADSTQTTGGAQEGQPLYPGGPMVGNADGQVVPGSVTGHIHTWQTIAGTSNQVCTVCGQTR